MIRTSQLKLLAVAVALTLGAGTANASLTSFFGENLSPGNMVTGDPVTARDAFLATLSGVGTETFEGASGSSPIAATFTGSTGNITATLSGSGLGVLSGTQNGRFATSGSNYIQTDAGGDFVINFSTAISAFGFFGTDVGDFGNGLILSLLSTSGVTTTLPIGNTLGSSGSTNGSLVFFGFIDTAQAYTSISFLNRPGGSDVFGFDDLTIGDRGQIITPPNAVIPLPAAGWLLLTALGGFGLMRRRKVQSEAA